MADKKLTYNDIALRLNRLQTKMDRYTGDELTTPEYATLVKQRDDLNKQLDAAMGKTKYSDAEVSSAANSVENLRNQIKGLQNLGVPDDDQRIKDLNQQLTQAQNILDDYSKDPNNPSNLKAKADAYIKEQNAQLAGTQKTQAKQQDLENQLKTLQKQKADAQALNESTTSIDAKINDLNNQMAAAQPKPDFVPSPTAQGPSTTTPPAAPKKQKGTQQTTTDLGGFKTVKGVLNKDGQPYSGEYQNKYYKDGKIETDEQVKQDFLDKYQEQAKFIMSIPELGGANYVGPNGEASLLTRAIQGNWGPDQWKNEFKNTQWAQSHPGDMGIAEIQRVSDPKAYNIKYNVQQNRLAMLANQLGVNLTPQQLGEQISEDNKMNVSQVDQKAVDNGQDIVNWMMQNPSATDAEVMQRMAKYGTLPKNPGGILGANVNTLQGIARDYAVSGMFNPSSLADYALNMQQGTPGYDANTFEANAKQLAAQMYKPYAKQIQDGIKVSTLAAPYTNLLGSLLEISPSGIDLGAPTGYGKMVSSAMIGNNDPNNPIPMDPYDFAAQVRSLPEWLNTQNAHDTVMSGVNQMLRAFNFGGA